MRTAKTLLATFVAMFALLLPVTASAAADATANVTDDGDSFVYSADNDDYTVKNYNNGGVFNLDAGVGVSGLNSQAKTDDDNGIGTGDAWGDGSSDNFLNSNATLISDDSEDAAVAEANVGEDGEATAKAFDNDDVYVKNRNYGNLENLTLGVAVSGGNSQYKTDDDNFIETGSSVADADTLNEVNSNWTWVTDSEGAFALANVGEDGDAYAKAKDNDDVTVKNYNRAGVQNYTVALAVSGGNSQYKTDDNNSINSGDSSAQANANNFVNSNVTVVNGNQGGASAEANVGEDAEHGDESVAVSEDNDDVYVQNSNQAEVTNVSVAASVSGGNTQSNTDDSNHIQTGSSTGTSCSTNTVNSNWTVIGGSLPEGGDHGCN